MRGHARESGSSSGPEEGVMNLIIRGEFLSAMGQYGRHAFLCLVVQAGVHPPAGVQQRGQLSQGFQELYSAA